MAAARSRPLSSCSTASTASNIIERLNDLTKCLYCNGQLKDARLLPCHHSFCGACVQELIRSRRNGEFECPIDKQKLKVPQYGLGGFAPDYRTNDLITIRSELEESIYATEVNDTSTSTVDINLEMLNKSVKDIEHSSVMSQQQINKIFEDIFDKLRKKQLELNEKVLQKSKKQILNLEYEKFRLIQVKQLQNQSFLDSSFYEFDLDKPLQSEGRSATTSTPPSPRTLQSEISRITAYDNRASLLSCNIGQHHIDFTCNRQVVSSLSKQLDHIGSVCCEFDLKVRLDRNLLALEEYPFGMVIGGEAADILEWKISYPKKWKFGHDLYLIRNQSVGLPGITKTPLSPIVIANSDNREVIILNNNYNLVRTIFCKPLKSITDVAYFKRNIYICDSEGCQILILNNEGNIIAKYGRLGEGNGELKRPNGIAVDSQGRVIVSDSLNHRVKVLSPDLNKSMLVLTDDRKKGQTSVRFSFPCGVAVDQDDNIFITDTNNKRIVQMSRGGKFLKEIAPGGHIDIRHASISSAGNVLITDRQNGKIVIFDSTGRCTRAISGIITAENKEISFKQPYGISVDGTDKVYVTDIELNAVFIF